MRKMCTLLGSLKLTLALMLIIAIWFSLGIILSTSSQYGNTFRLLNDRLVADSLLTLSTPSPRVWTPLFHINQIQQKILAHLPLPRTVVVTWLCVALVLALMLGLNLICGTKEWIFGFFKREISSRKLILLVIHFFFGIILIAHLISSISGFRATVPLGEGKRVKLLNGTVMKIEKINIEESTRTKSGKYYWTTDGFVHQKIAVSIALMRNKQKVMTAILREFRPERYMGYRFTLCPFSFRSQVSHDFLSNGLREKILISRNPGTNIMLVFQPLLILAVLVYVIILLKQYLRVRRNHGCRN